METQWEELSIMVSRKEIFLIQNVDVHESATGSWWFIILRVSHLSAMLNSEKMKSWNWYLFFSTIQMFLKKYDL